MRGLIDSLKLKDPGFRGSAYAMIYRVVVLRIYGTSYQWESGFSLEFGLGIFRNLRRNKFIGNVY